MLKITIPGEEFFNEETQTFVDNEDVEIELEHSLVSVSKWESKYTKPFLSHKGFTTEEILFYVECMLLDQRVKSEILYTLTEDNFDEINEYINAAQSATTFLEPESSKTSSKKEVITAEVIYHWMIVFQIPMECQHWHLNRLFSLIKVASAKNGASKKLSSAEIARRNQELNAKRRAEMGTSG